MTPTTAPNRGGNKAKLSRCGAGNSALRLCLLLRPKGISRAENFLFAAPPPSPSNMTKCSARGLAAARRRRGKAGKVVRPHGSRRTASLSCLVSVCRFLVIFYCCLCLFRFRFRFGFALRLPLLICLGSGFCVDCSANNPAKGMV